MRLKSLKLAGFKSFANSTTFTFPRGITAIVGPNGCGKSNVIDAIRWVLGETSAKQLRGGAMSDVIFAGTQDKAAKSVASVELTFEHTQDEQTGIRHEFNLYQELSVRRQVNLEGRSDYFINGTRCRRRDVVDVFLGTGLGARSYAVIEQGMIGRIVESSPLQLREFIEEAAGVSRYQARRAETQKKLETTQDNLARLHDMQSELVRQQKTLSKQAASAQRYKEINETLANIKQQLAIQQLYQAKHLQQQHKAQHERSTKEVMALQNDYERLKAQQDKLTANINQEQWLKDDAQSAHYQQQLSYQQAAHQLNDAQSQLSQIEQQLAGLKLQREQAIAEIKKLKTEQERQQTELAKLRPQLSELTTKRERYKRDEQPLQRAWHEAQNALARLQESARTLEQQQALNSQSQQRLQLSNDKWARRQQNWQILWAQLQPPSASSLDENNEPTVNKTARVKIIELNDKLQQITRQQDSVAERLAERQPQATRLQQRLAAQQLTLAADEKRHALLAGEYDTLHQIVHLSSNKKLDKPSQSPLSIKNNVEDKTVNESYQQLPISTLRDQIELSAQGQEHAQVLDRLLALWLDSHVLVTNEIDKNVINNSQKANSLWQTFEHSLPQLLTYQQGRNSQEKSSANAGHSLWLPTIQRSNQDNNHANSQGNSQGNNQDNNQQENISNTLPNALVNKVFALSQLITQPRLVLWQECYLYMNHSETSAENVKEELIDILKLLPPFATLLTSDGWLMNHQGTINLSKFAGAQDGQIDSHFLTQRLQQRTRLQDLETLLEDCETEIQDQQQAISKNQREYDTLTVSLQESLAQAEQLTRDSHQFQQQLTTQQAAYERLQADIQRLNTDKVALELEQQELAEEQKILDREQQRIQQEKAALAPKIAEAQDNRQQLQTERHELSRRRQTDDDAWQTLQLSIQQSELRLEHSITSLGRATEQYDKSGQNEQTLITQLEHHQRQLPELQATLQTAQTARDAQQVLLNERETLLTALKHKYSQQQIELDKSQLEQQNSQSKLANQATALALSVARLEDASEKAQDALAQYYKISSQHNHTHNNNNNGQAPSPNVSVSSLLTDFIAYDRRVRPEKIIELETELANLEQQLNNIGAVNLAAVAELAEVNDRLEPLAQQTADIAASMDTLTDAITSIDETTKTLFMQTLDAVNTELANLFAKVFGGGHASLTLNVDDMPANTAKSEQWRAGLTLMAQPKGKRNSRLAVLSGGEKTLTALSLIFAIFKQHPAPFCVLDEVDAPLDDANVERFTSLIHELAGDLQFIFISHNKLAMQIADELKGITMPNAGISTLVSVSLEEAAHYIDR